jgi:hypothetical protein
VVEPAHLDAALPLHAARADRERAGRHLRESRFARAIDAQQPDPVVDVEPQIETAQDRRIITVADVDILEPHAPMRGLVTIGPVIAAVLDIALVLMLLADTA